MIIRPRNPQYPAIPQYAKKENMTKIKALIAKGESERLEFKPLLAEKP